MIREIIGGIRKLFVRERPSVRREVVKEKPIEHPPQESEPQ
jgi:hypothetical protein